MRAWALRSRSQSRLGNKEDALEFGAFGSRGELGADLSSLAEFLSEWNQLSRLRGRKAETRKGSGPRGGL